MSYKRYARVALVGEIAIEVKMLIIVNTTILADKLTEFDPQFSWTTDMKVS